MVYRSRINFIIFWHLPKTPWVFDPQKKRLHEYLTSWTSMYLHILKYYFSILVFLHQCVYWTIIISHDTCRHSYAFRHIHFLPVSILLMFGRNCNTILLGFIIQLSWQYNIFLACFAYLHFSEIVVNVWFLVPFMLLLSANLNPRICFGAYGTLLAAIFLC